MIDDGKNTQVLPVPTPRRHAILPVILSIAITAVVVGFGGYYFFTKSIKNNTDQIKTLDNQVGAPRVYTETTRNQFSVDISLQSLDPQSGFFYESNVPSSGYVINERYIYYLNGFLGNANPSNFKILRGSLKPMMREYLTYRYAADDGYVFFEGQELPHGVDPKTFHPIENGTGYHSYGTDDKTVYAGAKALPWADPKTFQILWETKYEGCGNTAYVKDATHVYFQDFTPMPDADASTFESLLNGYGKDNRGYYKGTNYVGPTIDPDEIACHYG